MEIAGDFNIKYVYIFNLFIMILFNKGATFMRAFLMSRGFYGFCAQLQAPVDSNFMLIL